MLRRLRILPQVWMTGRLAARLVRDRRVPLATKAIVAATLIYLVSPFDVMPDWLPFVGQADDLAALLVGLNLFLKMCPRWLVEEHEDDLAGRRDPRRSDAPDDWQRGNVGTPT
ncbi:MAG: DUF1232 domain-containing protein [Chloroflexi bacterium]|nr:DUF1232 domain-containing protein [Chloroflexota bacterium]